MKKSILKVLLVAVLLFVATIPMLGCNSEPTLEEYRANAVRSLRDHAGEGETPGWFPNYSVEHLDRVQMYISFGSNAINSANSRQEVRVTLDLAKRMICLVPRIPRYSTYVETEHFRLTFYVDREQVRCHHSCFVWVTTIFKNISDTDFYITSRRNGIVNWYSSTINSLGFQYDYDWFEFRSEVLKSGAKITNTARLGVFNRQGGIGEFIISAMADFDASPIINSELGKSKHVLMDDNKIIFVGEN